MRHLLLTALLVSGLASATAPSAFAQQDTVTTKVTTTTTTTTSKRGSKFSLTLGISDDEKTKRDSTKTARENKGRFVGGITFTRFDLGFTRLIDNGSFTL